MNASPDAYITWLIEKARARERLPPYSNRRRLGQYSVEVEDSVLVGKAFKNPITGMNYAYRLRCKKEVADEHDADLKQAFNNQAWKVVACLVYTGLTHDWSDVVNSLVWPVFMTELKGWRSRRNRPDKNNISRDQFIQKFIEVARGEDKDPPKWCPEEGVKQVVPVYDPANRKVDEGADLEFVAGAVWQRWVVDGDGLFQGISIVGSSLGAHTIARFWFNGGVTSSNPILWVLAGVGHWLAWDYIDTYLKDQADETAEASIGHKEHAIGGLYGLWTGYMKPSHKYQFTHFVSRATRRAV